MKLSFHKIEPISSHGIQLVCPHCRGRLALVDLKDGDQAYWCHRCEVGWRAGHLPDGARFERRKLLEVAPNEDDGERMSVLNA